MVSDDSSKPGEINKPGGPRAERFRMLGPRRENPHAPKPVVAPPAPQKRAAAKRRVLFVCIGNSCRSQVAEAFARAYGSDVMEVQSAGVSPG